MDALSTNERVLWQGVPRQGLMLRGADVLMIPFSLLWGGFSLFLEYSVMRSDAPMVLRLWSIPFVLMGAYMVGGRFVIEAWQRARTEYVVTNERIIIRSGILRRRAQSLELRALGDFALTENNKGEGTISFGVSAAGTRFTGLAAWPGDNTIPRFDTIADAGKVYEIIRKAHYAAGHTRPFGQRLG
ncbi:PH domain-containing protein [Pseudoduganella eburnea]|uniref:PH domain-containing protein n=1 Tax=Massilia eburnea TaxID=1776165 RepID=A0A6L6QCF8_9BURK|nr:PH domain-containing protein [Massilia eburnea]MTW10198.1 PH domain-containing protein [Massilia eburnea]